MPTKSIGLLPDSYASIATGELKEYFPEDFDIDLNGRALPWEAACLIPFVDESKAIELEAQMLLSYPLSEDDKRRN
jgi:5'-3' exonuclease